MSRKRNWGKYNRQLVQSGSITFYCDPKLFKSKKTKTKGRPIEYSDQLICMLMMLKIRFRLPYRALEGFADSLLKLQKCRRKIPNYTLICKRAAKLKGSLPSLNAAGKHVVVVLDATGVKIYGEGEWKVKIHGKGKARKWMKLHIAIDADSQEIISEVTTESHLTDGKMTQALLDQIEGEIKEVLADGAYDGKEFREAINRRGGKARIPPPIHARLWGLDPDRDDAIRIIRGLGGDKQARSLWGKLTGYSRRSLVESAFSRMKRLFGDRLFSKTFDRQEVENRLRCILLNKMRRVEG